MKARVLGSSQIRRLWNSTYLESNYVILESDSGSGPYFAFGSELDQGPTRV